MNPRTKMEEPSREVPEFLQKILAKDAKATKKLGKYCGLKFHDFCYYT